MEVGHGGVQGVDGVLIGGAVVVAQGGKGLAPHLAAAAEPVIAGIVDGLVVRQRFLLNGHGVQAGEGQGQARAHREIEAVPVEADLFVQQGTGRLGRWLIADVTPKAQHPGVASVLVLCQADVCVVDAVPA